MSDILSSEDSSSSLCFVTVPSLVLGWRTPLGLQVFSLLNGYTNKIPAFATGLCDAKIYSFWCDWVSFHIVTGMGTAFSPRSVTGVDLGYSHGPVMGCSGLLDRASKQGLVEMVMQERVFHSVGSCLRWRTVWKPGKSKESEATRWLNTFPWIG